MEFAGIWNHDPCFLPNFNPNQFNVLSQMNNWIIAALPIESADTVTQWKAINEITIFYVTIYWYHDLLIPH